MQLKHIIGPIDYVLFLLILLISLAIGIYHACTGDKQRTTNEFFLGNRRLKTFPVALSMLVSFLSGIVVLGTPAEMYTHGTQLFMRTIGYCLACVLSAIFIVPLFYRLGSISSFEYLEVRFKSKFVKLIGTISMLMGNIFYMGLVLYTPATAIHAVTGFNLQISIFSVALIVTLYTALGGLRAVVWTDAFQAFIMLAGLIIILIKGVLLVGSFEEIWRINSEGHRLIFFDFDPSPFKRLSFWSTVIGGTFSTLTIFGVGQTTVQRYSSLPTLSEARWSVLLNIPFLIIMNLLTSLIGLIIYAYYASIDCDPIKSKQIINQNQIVPFFVTTVLNFPGLPGVFLAVLFSGALSSMSSSLNSAAAVTWQDLLRYFFTFLSEGRKTLITKVLVIFYGGLALLMAYSAQWIGVHVLQASLSFSGATMGPTLGMYALGGIFPFANSKGAATGCLISSALTLWLTIGAFVVKPHRTSLPTSTNSCHLYNNNSDSISGKYINDSVFNLTQIIKENNYLFSEKHVSFRPVYLTYNTSNLEFNETVKKSSSVFEFSKIYEISFLWYSCIGCLFTIVIGIPVSLITADQKSQRIDKQLLIKCFQKSCKISGVIDTKQLTSLQDLKIKPLVTKL